MNDRIEQLLPKPFRAQGQQISYDGNDKAFCHLYSNTQMVEFAELIIKECLVKITQEQERAEQNWQCLNGVRVVYELQKHFGVAK